MRACSVLFVADREMSLLFVSNLSSNKPYTHLPHVFWEAVMIATIFMLCPALFHLVTLLVLAALMVPLCIFLASTVCLQRSLAYIARVNMTPTDAMRNSRI